MSGSTIGGVVGGVIGFYFGPYGAQIGWMIGSAVGGYVDPEVIKQTGPRLQDNMQQSSRDGVPITFGYGTFRTAGNIIWRTDPAEHINTTSERQGKGGPVVKATTYTYTRSYAIGICEGPVTGLLIAKRNGVIVYDARTDAELQDLGMTAQQIAAARASSSRFIAETEIYLGDETQDPSPTIEAVKGAGEVPAYRGLCYIVRPNEDLTELRKAIPQWEFVVCGQGTTSSTVEADLLAWWPLDDAAPNATAREVVNNKTGTYTANAGAGPAIWIGSTGSMLINSDDDKMVAVYNSSTSGFGIQGLTSYTTSCWLYPDYDSTGDPANVVSYRPEGAFGSAQWVMGLDGIDTAFAGSADSSNNSYLYNTVSSNREVFIVRTVGPSGVKLYVNGELVASDPSAPHRSASADYMIVGDIVTSNNNFRGFVSDVKVYGRELTAEEIADHYLPVDQYLSLPDSPDEYVDPFGNYGSPIVHNQVTRAQVSHADIISDLCSRVGIDSTQIDVSALENVYIDGYGIGTETGADMMVLPLCAAGFYDPGEWDGKLRFVPRGGSSALTLTADDLGERDGDAIEQTRVQEVELLRKVSVGYLSPRASYTPTTQTWERRTSTVQAKGESIIEIPITCTDDAAAQIAEKRGKVAWSETDKQKFSLPYKFSYLTPTDVVTMPDSGRVRVMNIEEDSGMLLIESVRDRAVAYSSTATGSTPTNTPPPSTSNTRGPTILRAMNLPNLTSADSVPGIYVAVTGVLPGWDGAIVYMSLDGGVSEYPVLTATSRATIGRLTAACTASADVSGTNPISVEVYDGRTLSSITTAQIAARLNAFAITSSGASEIGQFETATQTATARYDLTNTYRGLQGTTAATHAADDEFVMLDGAIYFIPIDPAYAGGTIILHAVTIGTDPDANTSTVSIVFDPPTFVVDGGEVTP